MTTGAIIVEDALTEAAILGIGDTVSAEDQQTALRVLNRMLDSWANENLMIFATTSETFLMTPSVASYSTSLLASRPVTISNMYVSLNNIDYPVDMIDEITYDAVPYKPVPAIPNQCYYDATYPNGTFFFFPTPYAAFTCHVNSRKELVKNVTATTDVLLPPGYQKAIVENLAVQLCKPFTKEPTQQMMIDARESKAVLKRTNYNPLLMTSVMDSDRDISNSMLYKGF